MTVIFGKRRHLTTTEWPWLWHPHIHWYHQYLNLSSVGPEICDGLHLGVLTQLGFHNSSHAAFKWLAQIIPNITAMNLLYNEWYEGTGKNMFICLPQLAGKFPNWASWDQIWICSNYTPEESEIVYRVKELGFIYKLQKPMVDIIIGIGTTVTVIGVPGIDVMYLTRYWNCRMSAFTFRGCLHIPTLSPLLSQSLLVNVKLMTGTVTTLDV